MISRHIKLIQLMRPLSAILVIWLASGCGFEPVYNQTSPTAISAEAEHRVEIDKLDGRTGHRIRQELTQLFRNGVNGEAGPYQLYMSLDETKIGYTVKPDGAALRTGKQIRCDYRMTDKNGVVVAKGQVVESSSFAAPTDPYGNISLNIDNDDRLGRIIARSVWRDIARKLHKISEE